MKKIILPVLIFLCPLLLGGETVKSAVLPDEAYNGLNLPVVMYHNILNSKRGAYIVSEAKFENDLNCFLSEGYTTVFPSEVISYVKGQGTLPVKPIMITFDDGHYNNMYYALPILKRYNCKAVVNIIGKHSDYASVSGDDSKPNYSHLTWQQIRELKESGCFEIGNHTYNLHKTRPRYGISKLYNESDEQYRKVLTGDISKLQKMLYEYSGIKSAVFAYPFGKSTSVCREVLESLGFEMILTCFEGINRISRGDFESLLDMHRFNRNGNYSTETFLRRIKSRKAV